jgi:tetratricopeptide (TPR) repeat protein
MAWTVMAWRLGLVLINVGLLDEAHELVSELREFARTSGARFFAAASQRCLADLALARGAATEAIELLQPAIDELRALDAQNQLALALASLGRAIRRQGHEHSGPDRLREAPHLHPPLHLRGTGSHPPRARPTSSKRAADA